MPKSLMLFITTLVAPSLALAATATPIDAAYVRELEAQLAIARRVALEAQFKSARSAWPGMSGFAELTRDVIPHSLKSAFTMGGKAHFWGGVLKERGGNRKSENYTYPAYHGGQLAVGLNVKLRLIRGQPIWTHALFAAYESLLRERQTVSPGHYPHAAEDILMACQRFALPRMRIRDARVAVWSSISPWIETILLRQIGFASVTTVDYNPPRVAPDAAAEYNVTTLSQAELPGLYAASNGVGVFDLIISFSGLEHDGLGRYGDPINPDGDVAAAFEIRSMLKPGGLLLLGIPTAKFDNVVYPGHREYGPYRLPRIIEGFTMLGRVWDGKVVEGGLERADAPPPLFAKKGAVSGKKGGGGDDDRWQHEPVMVLRKGVGGGSAF